MARKNTPQPLEISDEPPTSIADHYSPLSPTTPKSPKSPFAKFASGRKLQKERDPMQVESQSAQSIPPSQSAPFPSSSSSSSQQQPQIDKQERPTKSGFFSNYKAAKSAKSLQQTSQSANYAQEDSMSREDDRAGVGHVSSKDKPRSASSQDRSTKRRPVGGPKSSDLSIDNANEPSSSSNPSQAKKGKSKPFGILNRTRSTRDDDDPQASPTLDQPPDNQPLQPLGNAPLGNNEKYRDMPPTNVRQRSEDRRPGVRRETSNGRDSNRHQQSNSSTGHGFLSGLRGSAAKSAAGVLSKGFFGKGGRSSSTNEREINQDDDIYVLRVLCLPLIAQTRITRISKRLENSRDKTEFWMPAFPWRAIDFLNYKGCEVEGLYRVPGSAAEIKKWQRRFDQELDIDLFLETELYDINIIGSMFKSWLRELLEPLLPRESQDRVQREAPNAETVPDCLIEELSNLSPFNYYLLFAITCHLSLLLAHSDKNKMGYHNLLICFQPCLKIDAHIFRFLVCHWRECWKGCKTEAQYITEEYKLFEPQPPVSADGSVAVDGIDEWQALSSETNRPTINVVNDKTANMPSTQGQDKYETIQNTTLHLKDERNLTRNELKRLSEIKPLSPMDLPHTRD